MGDLIGIDVDGIEEVQAILRKLPREAQGQVTRDVSAYLLNVLKTYPPYRYISRASAYPDAPAGNGFFTEKQRRWFFAHLNEVTPPYERTQGYRDAWEVLGQGPQMILVNQSEAAQHLQDDNRQSRMAAKGGWKKLKDIIQERMNRMATIAEAAARKAIKKLDKTAP